MSYEEKSAWLNATVFTGVYGWYILDVLALSDGAALVDTPFLWSMIGATIASVVLLMVGNIGIAIASREEKPKPDLRDKTVFRSAAYSSHWLLYGGGVAVIALAVMEADLFWIANLMYFTMWCASVLLESLRVVFYRRGVPAW
jgi:uncharacterized membrane protein